MTTGVADAGTGTDGTGFARYHARIAGVFDVTQPTEGAGTVNYHLRLTGSGDQAQQNSGGFGIAVYDLKITGSGDSGTGTDGTGSSRYVFNPTASGDSSTGTDGTGTVNFHTRITGLGEASYGSGSNDLQTPLGLEEATGTVGFVYGIIGAYESGQGTDGTGLLQFGTLLAKGDVGVGTDGTGTLEFIPTLSAIVTPVYYFNHISTNTTTAASGRFVCTASLTLTLNDSPEDGETVLVKTTAANVTVAGNGNNIDGATSHTISTAYDVRTIVYTVVTDEWLITAN